jgi:hypothetical protein
MLTNKKNHLKFCGREATALFPSPGGLKYKGFSKFIKEKFFRFFFYFFIFFYLFFYFFYVQSTTKNVKNLINKSTRI